MYYFKFRNYIAIDMIWKFNPTDVFILILAMIYRLTVSWKKGKKKKCPLQEKRGLPSQFLLQWGEIISEVLIAFLHLTKSEEIMSNYYHFQTDTAFTKTHLVFVSKIKVASSRLVCYSILENFVQRSQYISIKITLHKQTENVLLTETVYLVYGMCINISSVGEFQR